MKWGFLPHGKHCVCVKKTNWLMLFRGNKHFFFVRIALNLYAHYVGEMRRFNDNNIHLTVNGLSPGGSGLIHAHKYEIRI